MWERPRFLPSSASTSGTNCSSISFASPADQPGLALAGHSRPAFAIGSLDPVEKSESYEVFQHPEGGRKDVFHWGPQDEKPVAELVVYRPGGEFNPSQALLEAEIAARMGAGERRGLEPAGVVDSKFGTVTLLRLANDPGGPKSCLGFFKRLGDVALQLSGWSCQGDGLPARRAAIGCTLNRLTLLSAGNEPKLAELFARAELRRGGCGAAAPPPATDWLAGGENPRLRGPL